MKQARHQWSGTEGPDLCRVPCTPSESCRREIFPTNSQKMLISVSGHIPQPSLGTTAAWSPLSSSVAQTYAAPSAFLNIKGATFRLTLVTHNSHSSCRSWSLSEGHCQTPPTRSCSHGCVLTNRNILSPADSKSQQFPISAEKAGRTTFVVSFIWLPGQCKNYQQNSFLAPSPVELCMGRVWNIEIPPAGLGPALQSFIQDYFSNSTLALTAYLSP